MTTGRKKKFVPPYSVDVWEERDRLSIVVPDNPPNEESGYYVMGRKGMSVGWYKTRQEAEKVAKQLNYRGGTLYKVEPEYPIGFRPVKRGKKNPPLDWDKSVGDLGEAELLTLQVREFLTKIGALDDIWQKASKIYHILGNVKAYLSRSHGADFKFYPNSPATEVYRNIIQIKAKKKDGRLYQHNFQPGSSIFGMSDGSILIKSRKGKKLWKNFSKGRK